jgi:putative endonuclease
LLPPFWRSGCAATAVSQPGGNAPDWARSFLLRPGRRAGRRRLPADGFRILDRHWKCAEGELGIVAVEQHFLVLCEVKTRSGTRHGTPLEKISQAKRNRLRRLAIRWLNAHGIRFDQVCIDVIGLLYEGSGGFTIEHIREVG